MVALTSVCFNECGPAALAFIMVRVQKRIYGFCIGKAVRCFIASSLTWPPLEQPAVLVMWTLSFSPSPLTPDIIDREGQDRQGAITAEMRLCCSAGWTADALIRFAGSKLPALNSQSLALYSCTSFLLCFTLSYPFSRLFFHPHHSVSSLSYVLPFSFPADEDGVLFSVSGGWPLDGWSDYQPDSSLRLTLESVSILPPEIDRAERAPKSCSTRMYKKKVLRLIFSQCLTQT